MKTTQAERQCLLLGSKTGATPLAWTIALINPGFRPWPAYCWHWASGNMAWISKGFIGWWNMVKPERCGVFSFPQLRECQALSWERMKSRRSWLNFVDWDRVLVDTKILKGWRVALSYFPSPRRWVLLLLFWLMKYPTRWGFELEAGLWSTSAVHLCQPKEKSLGCLRGQEAVWGKRLGQWIPPKPGKEIESCQIEVSDQKDRSQHAWSEHSALATVWFPCYTNFP